MGNGPSNEPLPNMKQRPTLGAPPSLKYIQQPNAKTSSENKKFSEEVLVAHNEYRALHHVPPLKLSKKLTDLAQEWAERLTMIGVSEARPNNKYGENIYWSRWLSDANSVCASWYKEGKHYKYNKEPDPQPVNNVHFTQMIWKSTSELGVGRAVAWSNVSYIVCNYKVKGNIKNEYMKNLIDPASIRKKSTVEEVKYLRTDSNKLINGSIEEYPVAMVDSNFLKMMLRLTNEFRSVHGSKDLKLSGLLNELAQKEAEHMAGLKKMEPSPNSRFGCSCYASKWSYDPKDITQFWYKESKRFKFGIEPDVVPLSSLDFTQMIWSGSNEVGYGRAKASNGFVYVVAYYHPRGNIRGEFTKNVKPFSFDVSPQSTGDHLDSIARKRSVSRIAAPQQQVELLITLVSFVASGTTLEYKGVGLSELEFIVGKLSTAECQQLADVLRADFGSMTPEEGVTCLDDLIRQQSELENEGSNIARGIFRHKLNQIGRPDLAEWLSIAREPMIKSRPRSAASYQAEGGSGGSKGGSDIFGKSSPKSWCEIAVTVALLYTAGLLIWLTVRILLCRMKRELRTRGLANNGLHGYYPTRSNEYAFPPYQPSPIVQPIPYQHQYYYTPQPSASSKSVHN